MIDDYARTEGTTWEVMRGSRNIDPSPKRMGRPNPNTIQEVAVDKLRLIGLVGALVKASLGQNDDVQRNLPNLCFPWGNFRRQMQHAPPQGVYDVYGACFHQKLTSKLRVPHGVTKMGAELFRPVVRFDGSMGAVYSYNKETRETEHREIPNRQALRQYGKSEARGRNKSIIRDPNAPQANKTEKWTRGRKRDAIMHTDEKDAEDPHSRR